MSSAQNELKIYYLQNGQYPIQEEGLEALANIGNKLNVCKDAWGNPLEYSVNGKNVALTSLGQDNLVGANGLNQDILLKW